MALSLISHNSLVFWERKPLLLLWNSMKTYLKCFPTHNSIYHISATQKFTKQLSYIIIMLHTCRHQRSMYTSGPFRPIFVSLVKNLNVSPVNEGHTLRQFKYLQNLLIGGDKFNFFCYFLLKKHIRSLSITWIIIIIEWSHASTFQMSYLGNWLIFVSSKVTQELLIHHWIPSLQLK